MSTGAILSDVRVWHSRTKHDSVGHAHYWRPKSNITCLGLRIYGFLDFAIPRNKQLLVNIPCEFATFNFLCKRPFVQAWPFLKALEALLGAFWKLLVLMGTHWLRLSREPSGIALWVLGSTGIRGADKTIYIYRMLTTA